MLKNNPAEQLLAILKNFNEIAPHNRGAPLLKTWGKVLGAGELDFSERFAQLQFLVEDIKRLIEADDGILKKDRYLAWYPLFSSFLSTAHLLNGTEQIAGHFEPNRTIFHTLEFCSEALSKSFGTDNIAEEDLNEISQLVDELYATAKDELKDPALKTVIMELVEGIRQALRQYEIRGSQGIQEALERLAGSIIFHQSQFKQHSTPQTTSKVKAILEKGFNIFVKIGSIKDTLEGAEKICSLVEKLNQ